MPGKYYVYVHKRASDGSIFYVGKGSGRRLLDLSGRNAHWKRVVDRHGFTASKICSDLPEVCALSIERALIHKIGMKNLTNQKDSALEGAVYSEEVRKKMSDAKKGWTPPVRSKETKRKMAASLSRPIVSSRGETFDNGIEAVNFLRKNGYPTASRGNISSVITGKLKSCYGRTWARASDGIPDYQPRVSEKRKAVIRSDGATFCSAAHAAKSVNGSQGNISMCCRGERKVAYGYKWEYK